MQHYWGAAAIMARLGIRSHQTLYRWIDQQGLPVCLRAKPRSPCRRQLYSNEHLILAWELEMCRTYRAHRITGRTLPDPVRIVPVARRRKALPAKGQGANACVEGPPDQPGT